MRILIVKLGSIGDIVHTLPALAALRAAMPQAEISWVVERRSSEILKDNPLLDRLIEVDTKALRRGLMSGETLRAPRQQLRWFTPRPSILIFLAYFTSVANHQYTFSNLLTRVGISARVRCVFFDPIS